MASITYEADVAAFFGGRIEEKLQSLLKENGEFVLAYAKSKELIDNINAIAHHDRDLTITPGDCADLKDFLEYEFIQSAIMQQELYTQGYLDCVKLLGMLGIIKSN